MATTSHAHTPEGADECFGCKMSYMRTHGGLSVTTPVMRDGVSWFDTTYKEQQDIMQAEPGPAITPKPVRNELV